MGCRVPRRRRGPRAVRRARGGRGGAPGRAWPAAPGRSPSPRRRGQAAGDPSSGTRGATRVSARAVAGHRSRGAWRVHPDAMRDAMRECHAHGHAPWCTVAVPGSIYGRARRLVVRNDAVNHVRRARRQQGRSELGNLDGNPLQEIDSSRRGRGIGALRPTQREVRASLLPDHQRQVMHLHCYRVDVRRGRVGRRLDVRKRNMVGEMTRTSAGNFRVSKRLVDSVMQTRQARQMRDCGRHVVTVTRQSGGADNRPRECGVLARDGAHDLTCLANLVGAKFSRLPEVGKRAVQVFWLLSAWHCDLLCHVGGDHQRHHHAVFVLWLRGFSLGRSTARCGCG